MRLFLQRLAVLAAFLAGAAQSAHAQGTDPNAARMLPASAKRVVLTASVVVPNPRGRGVETADVKPIKVIRSWIRTGAVPADVSG